MQTRHRIAIAIALATLIATLPGCQKTAGPEPSGHAAAAPKAVTAATAAKPAAAAAKAAAPAEAKADGAAKVAKTADPKPCARTYEAFDVHGSGTKAGVVRFFRVAQTFSQAGGEGGTTKLRVTGLKDGKLRVERSKKPWVDDTKTKASNKGRAYEAEPDASFRVEHAGMAVQVGAKTVVQRGTYRIARINDGCFQVTLVADIPPYEGE